MWGSDLGTITGVIAPENTNMDILLQAKGRVLQLNRFLSWNFSYGEMWTMKSVFRLHGYFSGLLHSNLAETCWNSKCKAETRFRLWAVSSRVVSSFQVMDGFLAEGCQRHSPCKECPSRMTMKWPSTKCLVRESSQNDQFSQDYIVDIHLRYLNFRWSESCSLESLESFVDTLSLQDTTSIPNLWKTSGEFWDQTRWDAGAPRPQWRRKDHCHKRLGMWLPCSGTWKGVLSK